MPSASKAPCVVSTQSTILLRPTKRAASRAMASIRLFDTGISATAAATADQPPIILASTSTRSIAMRCCSSACESANKNGDFKKSSKAAVCAPELTSSIQDASTAAARVVESFQPVSSATTTCARSSSARRRRAGSPQPCKTRRGVSSRST